MIALPCDGTGRLCRSISGTLYLLSSIFSSSLVAVRVGPGQYKIEKFIGQKHAGSVLRLEQVDALRSVPR